MNTQSFVEELCQECEPYLTEFRKQLFHAEVLTRETRIICSGTAHLEPDEAAGAFWPESKWPSNTNTTAASILKHPDGRQFKLAHFELCPAVGGTHFHFHVEPKA